MKAKTCMFEVICMGQEPRFIRASSVVSSSDRVQLFDGKGVIVADFGGSHFVGWRRVREES